MNTSNALQLLSRGIVAIFLACSLACALSACGDDDGASGTGATGGSGGNNGGSGGTGGVGGGNGGTGGSGGTGGFDVGEPITCGTLTCNPTTISPACCTAEGTGEPDHLLEFVGRAPGQCGTDLGRFSPEIDGICLQLRQPGTLDSNCPPVENAQPNQPAYPGCCTEEGFCGGYEGFLPLGCSYSSSNGRGAPCGTNIDAGTTDGGDSDSGT